MPVGVGFDDASGTATVRTYDGTYIAEVARDLLAGDEDIGSKGSGHSFIVTGRWLWGQRRGQRELPQRQTYLSGPSS